MKLYEIHAPLGVETIAAHEGARAARTGFSFAALVFGPLWLLVRGQWLALAVYVLAVAAVVAMVFFGVLRPGSGLALFALGHLYLAFAGRALASDARERSGRPLVDLVFAGSALEAEKLYFERVLRPSPPLARRDPPASSSDVIGMFPEPGR